MPVPDDPCCDRGWERRRKEKDRDDSEGARTKATDLQRLEDVDSEVITHLGRNTR